RHHHGCFLQVLWIYRRVWGRRQGVSGSGAVSVDAESNENETAPHSKRSVLLVRWAPHNSKKRIAGCVRQIGTQGILPAFDEIGIWARTESERISTVILHIEIQRHHHLADIADAENRSRLFFRPA